LETHARTSTRRAIVLTVCVLSLGSACARKVGNQPVDNRPRPTSGIWNPPMGQDAPDDAFFHDEPGFAYYGTDSPWNLRFFYGYFDDWENRRGQRMMLDIMNSKYGDAEAYARRVMEREPENLEAHFNLAAALAWQGRTEEAVQVVHQSVAAGLPIERYLAGPRRILRPLTQSAPFQAWFAGQAVPRLLHGPMVGQVTDEQASFWVRTFTESDVSVRVSTDRSVTQAVVAATGRSRVDRDFTAIVNIAGLQPDTRYYYEVIIDGMPATAPGQHAFRTYPSSGSGAAFSVAFGGGAGYVQGHERIWDAILQTQPLAFLALGDNEYFNMLHHANHPFAMQHYSYYRRQSRPEFRRLTSAAAIYAIWDDHEFTDDIWLGPYRHKPFWKIPLFEQFRENWVNPSYGSEEWPGVWHSFSIADVDFFMLDGRFYRTNPYAVTPSRVNAFAPHPTMLGPEQKAWLLHALKESSATFKVIVSPVPWAYDAKPGSVDTWNGFRQERDDIFDFLSEHRIPGVVLVSADRHRSDAWRIERPGAYPLYEFSSSRLTNEHLHPVMEESLFGYNHKQSFGVLRFDLAGDDPALTYEIHSIDAELVYTLVLRRSELRHVP
jgi:alkaline phosphatase D